MFREEVIKLLMKELSKNKEDIDKILTVPPNLEMGDFAFPCFMLAKEKKKSPLDIAKELANSFKVKGKISKIEANGSYVNFYVSKGDLASEVLNKILKEKDKYGISVKKGEKIVIEYPSPNTNKPLHLGHIRNMLLGSSLSKILTVNGNKVIQVNLNNDRGIHICKSMLAYEKFGKDKKPDKKSDHFVGDYYVLFSKKANKKLEEEAQEMLKKWEDGDKKVRALWKKMNGWALKGFNETYKKFGLNFDKVYNESEIYIEGKEKVLEGLKKGVFKKKDDGTVFIDLEDKGMGEKVLLRADGTSIYITQDIYLAQLKYKDFKFDRGLIIVGNEQDYHFKVLTEILKVLKLPFSEKYTNFSYGMIYLPEGRMKSREGTVVDADELLKSMIDMARSEIEKRDEKISKKEREKRAEVIGTGALRFFILKYDPLRDFTFNPDESISFEGETGPYLQYTYARIQSILNKYGGKVSKGDYSLLTHQKEHNLISSLGEYEKVVSEASERLKPSSICRYLLDLSQTFNEYYHECPILKSEEKVMVARLNLIKSVAQVISNGLSLLNIEVLDEM
jgi:arginyl-tRNA synthetase